MRHVNVRVSGKVQGVFFRASAKDHADRLGINGFVRNEPNGDVYLEAEGREENLKNFLDWCARGPAHARVDHVTISESEAMNFLNFEIHR
jgi:acylphosphatase